MTARKMRRSRQQLPDDISKEILRTAPHGVLSLAHADGCPYGVPMSFAYDGGKCIYFHSARQGHKIECIDSEPRCSLCIIDRDDIVPEEFTTYFRSVIVHGKIRIATDSGDIEKGLLLLCGKYSPGIDPEAEIERCIGRVAVLRLDIESITGKQAIELVGRNPLSVKQ